MERYVFDIVQERWYWEKVGEDGATLVRCRGHFDFYLDCLSDAKANGMKGSPFFHAASGEIMTLPLGNHVALVHKL